MSDDPLPHLITFAKTAELNSFTAAAQAFGLTQAAVSQRIQMLEQALGVPLFTRKGGRVFLTEAGQRLYSYAQRILLLYQEARQEVTGHRAPLVGELLLAASSIPGEHLLPELLSVYQRKHPHIQLRVTVADSQAVLDQVAHGHAHLGLVGRKDTSPHFEYRCIGCDTLALVVPADHPWGQRRRVSLEQFFRQPLILREVGSGSRWCLEQALAKVGKSLSDLKVAMELGSNEAIKEAVLRGMGVTVLSTHAIEKERTSGRLHSLQVTGLSLLREMFVVWDRRRVLPIPARLFLDILEPCREAGAGQKRRE
jgi:DNA-binding transcriptional LysR family regulator